MQITRANWREFCTEPELTVEENQERLLMRYNFRRQPGLFDYIQDHTSAERDAVPRFNPADGWDKFPTWADAIRRRHHAELAAWREWKEATSQGQVNKVPEPPRPTG